MRRRARSLARQRFAQPADARQLQAIVLSVTGELHDFDKGGSPPWSVPEKLVRLTERIERALAQLERTPVESLDEPRAVGRKQLPTTVLGLLFHAAEHSTRHAGQIVTTAKIVLAEGLGPD